jgi:N-glycosylase/DNA lyase
MTMKKILDLISELKKSKVKEIIDERIKEFESVGKKSRNEIFNELCFCLLTANFNAEKSIKIQNKLGNGFSNFPEKKLAKKLKELGHRHPNVRADYICNARTHNKSLKKVLNSFKNDFDAREWVVKNVKGLGYKEASHFLRNIGCKNLAIIDFHIVDLLVRYGLIKEPKTLTKNRYLEIEKILREIAKKAKLNLAELDLYLWYAETGEILK